MKTGHSARNSVSVVSSRLVSFLGSWLVTLLVLTPALADPGDIAVTVSCGLHGDISPKGALVVPKMSDLTVTATPDTGYEIDDWFVDGQPGGWSVNQITFHLGDKDVSVNVVFQRITNLVHTTAGNSGQLSPGGNGGSVPIGWGDDAVFTATAGAHYHVDTWTLDDLIAQSGDNSFTIHQMTTEHWLTVEFAPDTYLILASAGPHGMLTPAGAVPVAFGDSQAFTAAPEPGYDRLIWLLDDLPVLTNATRFTISNVDSNHTLLATFSRPQLAIALTATNTLLLSWPEAITEFVLEETPDLTAAHWTGVSGTAVELNGVWRQEVGRPVTQRFYRLASR